MIAVEVTKKIQGSDITVEFGRQQQVSLIAMGDYAQTRIAHAETQIKERVKAGGGGRPKVEEEHK